MLFLLLFIIGGLIIPIMFDIQKHGKDNIFHRSGRDLLGYEPIRGALRFCNVSARRVNDTVLNVLGVLAMVFALYLLVGLIGLVRRVIDLFGK